MMWVVFSGEDNTFRSYINGVGCEVEIEELENVGTFANQLEISGDLPFCFKHILLYFTKVSSEDMES